MNRPFFIIASSFLSLELAAKASISVFSQNQNPCAVFGVHIKLRFSYSLYRAFCSNSAISGSSKAYVAQRLSEQGIDDMAISAGTQGNLVDTVNDAVLAFIDDLKLRQDLQDVRERGMERPSGAQEEPDFEAWYARALEDAEASCTNNDWGMDDAFYSESIDGRLDRLAGAQSGETFSNQTEAQDFSFFLKVCGEAGLEPLVIISPVHGEFYDHVGMSAADRQACYERIRSICELHGVQYVDFSDREYEQYFLHDIVHFGWTGWVAVEEAIYNYVEG